MSTAIYHFTGTGNSLKVARDVAAGLDDASLVALARATDEELSPTSDTVGIVFPVYAWGPPAAVSRFIDKVNIPSGTYVFAICTCGGSASGTLHTIDMLLKEKGIKLSSGFVIKMPSNYIPWGGALPEEKQQAMFAAASDRISEIQSVVKEKKVQAIEKGSLLGRLLTRPIYNFSMKAFKNADSKFTVTDSCNGCGICEKVCQVGNIEMKDGKPSWQHRCEQCVSCIQFCPQEAIQVGTKTVGRKRYHHPEVKASDLM